MRGLVLLNGDTDAERMSAIAVLEGGESLSQASWPGEDVHHGDLQGVNGHHPSMLSPWIPPTSLAAKALLISAWQIRPSNVSTK